MSDTDPRAVALDVLLRVEGGAHSDRALDRALRRARLDDRDRRLTTELVYGTLRRLQTLDRNIGPHCHRPLQELDAPVRVALRLGLYQCCFLDSVPEHAAVNVVVAAVKRYKPQAAGLVNGVLRACLRAGSLTSPAADDDLARRCDLPAWWARRWQDRHGEEAAGRWLERALQAAPLVLRPHPRVLGAEELCRSLASEGVRLAPAGHCPGAFLVMKGSPLATSAFAAGCFSLRGEASQMII
ncbi:MAG: transcription antitermination factor NusB, partial [Acidobacteriota bacterium]